MCGIVGYIGSRDAAPILLTGLERLEYRGYDSAGIACLDRRSTKDLIVVKEKGKLERLREEMSRHVIHTHIGIGHTRWATHGVPSRVNAHPHTDEHRFLALVHNGIIENYAALKTELQGHGVKFQSATDTEVAVNLIGYYFRQGGDLTGALKRALKRMHGFFAFALISPKTPDQLLVFKRSNPLVIGLGKGENFVASDVTAILPYTKRVLYLEDDEYAVLTRSKVEIFSLKTGKHVRRDAVTIRWNVAQAQKSGYPHFMLKEIYEQPEVVETILKGRVVNREIVFEGLAPRHVQRLRTVKRVHFVSCGTAYHAGLVGNYMLEQYANLPVGASVSSEFRYEDPCVGEQDLVVLITQSGETADTLAALREAQRKGALTLAVVNVVGSTIAREADLVIYTHAGPEIGVASTKAYLAQLVILALFSLYMARLRKSKNLSDSRYRVLLNELTQLPAKIRETLKQESIINKCARKLHRKQTFLYLGRGYNYPNALEGALKLKEITYSHAHGYPAGEMKHGPIALIDSNQPVICLTPLSQTYEKMLSNIEEIKARKGIVISIATRGDKAISRLSDYTFWVPKIDEMLSPVLTAIPLQLFAYRVAVLKKRDVDQPRNLAKSVTVE